MTSSHIRGFTVLVLVAAWSDPALAADASRALTEYTWLVVFAAFCAFGAAYGIGANDVANAYATSVGAGSLTIAQASCLAAVFEFAGAVTMGSSVSETVRKGIANPECFEDNPGLLMWGMTCVIIATGIWLVLASYLEMPVSTTHSCIGGIIGMTIMARSSSCVVWYEEADEFPYVKGVVAIVVSWILSPVASGVVAAALYAFTHATVLRFDGDTSFRNAKIFFPFLVGVTIWVNMVFMILKGTKGKDEELGTEKMVDAAKDGDPSEAIGVGAIVGAVALVLTAFATPYLGKRAEENAAAASGGGAKQLAPGFSSEDDVELAASALAARGSGIKLVASSLTLKEYEALKAAPDPADVASHPKVIATAAKAAAREAAAAAAAAADAASGNPLAAGKVPEAGNEEEVEVSCGGAEEGAEKEGAEGLFGWMGKDPKESLRTDAVVGAMHGQAQVHDKRTEEMFKYVQVFTAIVDSFSHGANDVANAMGPFAAVFMAYKHGVVEAKTDVGDDMYWILAIGGAGIVLGLATYGYKIMEAIGVKLVAITPSRGFNIELGAAFVIIFGTTQGWPLSTTHCQVGATVGVGLFEGKAGVNRSVLYKTVFGWVVTLVVVGLTAAVLVGPSPEPLKSAYCENYAP